MHKVKTSPNTRFVFTMWFYSGKWLPCHKLQQACNLHKSSSLCPWTISLSNKKAGFGLIRKKSSAYFISASTELDKIIMKLVSQSACILCKSLIMLEIKCCVCKWMQSFRAHNISLSQFYPTSRTVTSKQEIMYPVPQKYRSVLADVCHSFYCSWIIWSFSHIWQCKLWVQLLSPLANDMVADVHSQQAVQRRMKITHLRDKAEWYSLYSHLASLNLLNSFTWAYIILYRSQKSDH